MVCGSLLLAFEATTIYVTQVSLLKVSESAVTASSTRVADLRVSIDQRRQAAKSLRENGTLQSASSNAWTRTLGANALRDALKVEQGIEPLSAELMQLQKEAKPAMSSVLGPQGMLWYSVARAVLISGMGLVMFAAAGALLREARGLCRRVATREVGTPFEGRAIAPVQMPLVVYSLPILHAAKTTPDAIPCNVVQFKSDQPKPQSLPDHDRERAPTTMPTTIKGTTEKSVQLPLSPSTEPTHLPKKASSIAELIAEGWCRKIPGIYAGATGRLHLKRA